jgi:O-methyltransferase
MGLSRNLPIISDQISRPALDVVLQALSLTVSTRIPGDIVEFGCYIGTTSLFIRRLLNELQSCQPGKFFAYDSFAGLPSKGQQDASAAGVDFAAGELNVSKKQFLRSFQQAQLQPPITYKAWFNELTDTQLPSTLAFAFLDGDFYDSILTSLRLVWPRLSIGGTIAIDDYQRETLPGVERAVHDFFGHTVHPKIIVNHNIAVLHK